MWPRGPHTFRKSEYLGALGKKRGVCMRELHFPIWIKWEELYLSFRFVVSGGCASFPSFLLSFYFSLSILLSAYPIFTWNTHIDSDGVFWDLNVLTKRGSSLKRSVWGIRAETKRMLLILGWVRRGVDGFFSWQHKHKK